MAAVVYSATGKRKTSVARVRLMPGTGNITVNGKDVKDYFNRQTLMLVVRSPLVETGTDSRYDVVAHLHGGGKSGQAVDGDHTCAFPRRRFHPERFDGFQPPEQRCHPDQ